MKFSRSLWMLLGILACLLIHVPLANAQLLEDSKGKTRFGIANVFNTPNAKLAGGNRFYFGTEYLLWDVSSMTLPPLVTGNPLGTAAAEAGVIGVPSTTVLLGNDDIFNDARSGYRLSGGIRLCDRAAIEADYFQLADQDESFRFDSGLNQILGRPFINLGVTPIRQDTQLFEFPDPDPAINIDGSLTIAAFSQFQGLGTRFRINLIGGESCASGGCDTGCASGCCDSGCDSIGAFRKSHSLSLTVGYRHLDLGEGIRLNELLVSDVDRFDVVDRFETQSRFNGLELGSQYQCEYGFLGASVFGNLGIGVNSNDVRISGETRNDGILQATPGGILTQTSNIGDSSESLASMMAQFGVNLHARLFSCATANVGYSGLYWNNVARAGEQIDSRLHPGLFPTAVAPAGTIGAQRTERTSDLFAHGLNFGVTFSL